MLSHEGRSSLIRSNISLDISHWRPTVAGSRWGQIENRAIDLYWRFYTVEKSGWDQKISVVNDDRISSGCFKVSKVTVVSELLAWWCQTARKAACEGKMRTNASSELRARTHAYPRILTWAQNDRGALTQNTKHNQQGSRFPSVPCKWDGGAQTGFCFRESSSHSLQINKHTGGDGGGALGTLLCSPAQKTNGMDGDTGPPRGQPSKMMLDMQHPTPSRLPTHIYSILGIELDWKII